MVSMEHKKELSKLRAQFVRDFTRLRLEYDNLEMAQKIGMDPGNLSSYVSGKKLPGIKVLMHFYKAFADEIENPFEEHNPAPSHEFETQEPTLVYSHAGAGVANQLIETLKRENAELHKSVDTLFAANEKLIQSTLTLVEANRQLMEKLMAQTGT